MLVEVEQQIRTALAGPHHSAKKPPNMQQTIADPRVRTVTRSHLSMRTERLAEELVFVALAAPEIEPGVWVLPEAPLTACTETEEEGIIRKISCERRCGRTYR